MKYNITFFAAGLGTPEITLILITGLFFFVFFGVIIFLFYSLIKRRDSKYQAGRLFIEFKTNPILTLLTL